MVQFEYFTGTLIKIDDFLTDNLARTGCNKLMTLLNIEGNSVNFVVTLDTYFINHTMVRIGDTITGYYDASLPTRLIYPPQYQAIVMFRDFDDQNVKVDFFNRQLISSDNTLRLNIAPSTLIELTNGQRFTDSLSNRNLIVIYDTTTMSMPAQTTPSKIIVLCP